MIVVLWEQRTVVFCSPFVSTHLMMLPSLWAISVRAILCFIKTTKILKKELKNKDNWNKKHIHFHWFINFYLIYILYLNFSIATLCISRQFILIYHQFVSIKSAIIRILYSLYKYYIHTLLLTFTFCLFYFIYSCCCCLFVSLLNCLLKFNMQSACAFFCVLVCVCYVLFFVSTSIWF